MEGHFSNQPKTTVPTRKEVPVHDFISQERYDEIAGLYGIPFMQAAQAVLGSDYTIMYSDGVESREEYLEAIRNKVFPTEQILEEYQKGLTNPREAVNRNPDEDPGAVFEQFKLFADEAERERSNHKDHGE